MQAKSFRFGRLSSSQFAEKLKELNDFIGNNDIIGVPQSTSNDEEGTVIFVYYNEQKPQLSGSSLVKKDKNEKYV